MLHRPVRPLCQTLERRMLLSFSAATYFPMATGNTWSYSGHEDGHTALRNSTMAADTLNGIAISRLDEIASVGMEDKSYSSSYYSMTKSGLNLYQITGHDMEGKHNITFGTPVLVMPLKAESGQTIDQPAIPTTYALQDNNWNVFTFTGTSHVIASVGAVEQFSILNGKGITALPITLTLHMKLTGTAANGQPMTLEGDDVATEWLAAGVGSVKSADNAQVTITVGSESQTSSSTMTYLLQASPLLPATSWTLDNGKLKIEGTAGRDDITLAPAPASAGAGIAITSGPIVEYVTSEPITSIEVSTGDGDDRITMTGPVGPAYVLSGAGNDFIQGADSADTLTGGGGKDTLDGGAGNDRLNGLTGNDQLRGNLGDDRLYGGDNNDTLEGGPGVDRIWGGAGDDLLAGNGSNDKLFGEDGNDILVGHAGNDLLVGGTGANTFYAQDHAIDTIYATVAQDDYTSRDVNDAVIAT